MADNNNDKREMRMMWIASAGIALLILGAMGINMLVHHDTSAGCQKRLSRRSSGIRPPRGRLAGMG
jgi:hypothetical protein